MWYNGYGDNSQKGKTMFTVKFLIIFLTMIFALDTNAQELPHPDLNEKIAKFDQVCGDPERIFTKACIQLARKLAEMHRENQEVEMQRLLESMEKK